ncbi:MAG: choice-of-anchor L domain-containing protein [Flavobacteriales bacterium]|nr:choice-of-anchor L domain-containing protein [Flavobacteriales bacterium]
MNNMDLKQKAGAVIMMAMGMGTAHAQLQVSTNLTVQQLVTDVLVGSCVTVSNVTYNGTANPPAGNGRGSFNSINTNLGLGQGIILSSGNVQNIPGPASGFQSDFLGTGSDPDLVAIAGVGINDRSVLEFDFIPTGDTIRFRYVFASEEYPEWVCSFNDAFGFFLSGPGITGPYSNNSANIALIPGTTTPVTINNVNNGLNNNPNSPGCPAQNPQYYIDNGTGGQLVYDGMTVVLTATAVVQCGETYHIKLAIGDALDTAFDSGVFLEAGSFSSVPYVPEITPGPTIVGNIIYESCIELDIVFRRTSCNENEEDVVYLSYEGTAENGVDIVPPLPDEIVFGPGVSSITIPFEAPLDPDGPETFIINIAALDCNGNLATNSFEFIIDQLPDLQVTGTGGSILCGENITLTATAGGGLEPYGISWAPGGEDTPSISVSPTATTTYTVTVTDFCGSQVTLDYEVVLLPAPPLVMNIIGSADVLEGCGTGQYNIIRPSSTTGDLVITLTGSGTATQGEDYSLPPTVTIPAGQQNVIFNFNPFADQIIEGNETVTITGTYTNPCGQTVTASVTFTIIDVPPLVLEINNILSECSPDSAEIFVSATGGLQPYAYEWYNGATDPFIWVGLQNSGLAAVTVTDACGGSATIAATITIECEVEVPNVFTPNGDGINDFFVIAGLGNQENTVRIFNRWGQLILDAKNYQNNWAALNVPDGTYYYEVLVRNREAKTGHLTILRNRW